MTVWELKTGPDGFKEPPPAGTYVRIPGSLPITKYMYAERKGDKVLLVASLGFKSTPSRVSPPGTAVVEEKILLQVTRSSAEKWEEGTETRGRFFVNTTLPWETTNGPRIVIPVTGQMRTGYDTDVLSGDDM